MNKTALVIGATGLVGRALVDRLAAASHVSQVLTFTRRAAAHASGKVTNHVLDFDRLEDAAAAFRGDLLFSCLGTTLKQAGSVEAQRKVDVDYQLAAARLASRNGVRHYLLVSSSMANADSRNPYLRMKGELERSVLSLPFERISIFQPSVLVGERARPRPGEAAAAAVLRAVCILPGLRRHRPIRGDEVAARMIQVSREAGPAVEWFRLDEVFPVRGEP